MFYSPIMNKAVSKLKTRGALQYVHQDQQTGSFVASDGTVMLVENNGTPFMAEFWDTITQMPIDCVDKYPDWSDVLLQGYKDTKKRWDVDLVNFQNGLAVLNNLYVSAKDYALVSEFIGPNMIIDVPNSLGYPIHFQNSDKSRLALIMPYNATGEKIKKVKWNVLDTDGNVVYTTSNIQEAEMFGLTTKMIEDK